MDHENATNKLDSSNVDILQLCMDVPFVDHPYLIGPRGRKSQYFMNRYRSLIHFPDLNCKSEGQKANNVLITGSMKNVEEIRSQIRNRTPVRVTVQFDKCPNPSDIIYRMENAISERSLPIRLNYSPNYSTGMLKTEWRNKETLISLCDEFLDPKSVTDSSTKLFTLGIPLLPLVNPWNQELSHRLSSLIREQTSCQIYYPPKEKFVDQPPSYFIKGDTVSDVLYAAQFLIGLTMFQISFQLPPVTSPTKFDYAKIAEWQRDNLIHTTIEPIYHNTDERNFSMSYRVILRSFEFCISSIYSARSFLLGFDRFIITNDYDFMAQTKFVIPSTVFYDARLYYPLYALDNERCIDWSALPVGQFLNHFYGGPFTVLQQQLSVDDLCDVKMTKDLKALIDFFAGSKPDFNGNSICNSATIKNNGKYGKKVYEQFNNSNTSLLTDSSSGSEQFISEDGSIYAVTYPSKMGIQEFEQNYQNYVEGVFAIVKDTFIDNKQKMN